MDESLGRAAEVSGSKMLYEMNRLRRMAATFELQKEASLRKHAEAITLNGFPGGHPQERVVAGVWLMAKYGDGLVERLVGGAGRGWSGRRSVVRAGGWDEGWKGGGGGCGDSGALGRG